MIALLGWLSLGSGSYRAICHTGLKPQFRQGERLSENLARCSKELVGNQVSDFCPLATTLSAPSGSGRCSFTASAVGAVSHVSISAGVVRITGIAFG